jgi:membrane-associated phospholipid phosphatase
MFASLEQFLTKWLGNASTVGAVSWLQALTWVATLIAAFIAGVALRRNSLQSRAGLLLNIHKVWDDLAETRHAFAEFFQTTRDGVIEKHSKLQENHFYPPDIVPTRQTHFDGHLDLATGA